MHYGVGSGEALIPYDERKVNRMNRNGQEYEPPKMRVYRFDDNDLLLTASGESSPTPNYAANALNELFGGTNTTIE